MINRASGALERRCALDQFDPIVTLTPNNCNAIGFAPVLLWRFRRAVTTLQPIHRPDET